MQEFNNSIKAAEEALRSGDSTRIDSSLKDLQKVGVDGLSGSDKERKVIVELLLRSKLKEGGTATLVAGVLLLSVGVGLLVASSKLQ
jgi:hypothetical protein